MRAFQTSAIPPVAIFSSRTYWPNLMPSAGSSSSACGAGTAAGKTGCEIGIRSSFGICTRTVSLAEAAAAGGGVGRGAAGGGVGIGVTTVGVGTVPLVVGRRAFFSRPESVSWKRLSSAGELGRGFGGVAGAGVGGAGAGGVAAAGGGVGAVIGVVSLRF